MSGEESTNDDEIQPAQLVAELRPTLENVGEIESWLDERCDDSLPGDVLATAYRALTRELASPDDPHIPIWEHLVVATAAHSARSPGQQGLEAARAAIDELTPLVRDGDAAYAEEAITSLATALTLALCAQRRLRQTIEEAVALLCNQHDASVTAIAERCQDLWQRRGQMSGEESLFVWDLRQACWRLKQDFKPYRPPGSET